MQYSHSFFNVLQQYFAECALIPVFAISLIWIAKKWKTEYKRVIIAMLCGSGFVFNELVYRVFGVMGESITYYRLLWIVPVVFVIAVFLVENITRLKKSSQIAVVSILLLAVCLISGKTGEEWFSLPENIYQVDEDVIQVADILMKLTNGEPTYLLDNGDLSTTIRQYDARIMHTDNEEYGLWAIIEGESRDLLGSDIIQATWDDRSRYLALRKDEPFVHKLVESAGHTLAASTDNFQIYYVDYESLYWDWIKIRNMSAGLINQASIEYIPIAGVNEKVGYAYLTDFGAIENEDVYLEVFEKIKELQPQGIIINDQLSVNSQWYLEYEDLLEEMQIPYYCNNQEFQIIEYAEFVVCMVDNVEGISEETLEKIQMLENEDKPVVLVLSSKIETGIDELYTMLAEQDFVVQVLSAQKGGYTKELLGESLLQYAIPVDDNQIFSMIYIKGLEVKNE